MKRDPRPLLVLLLCGGFLLLILVALGPFFREAAVGDERPADKTTPEDWEKLRAVGFDDRAILHITMIGAWFNYVKCVADVLGVGR